MRQDIYGVDMRVTYKGDAVYVIPRGRENPLKITYEPDTRSMYIDLCTSADEWKAEYTEEMDKGGVLVDHDGLGNVYGIEIHEAVRTPEIPFLLVDWLAWKKKEPRSNSHIVVDKWADTTLCGVYTKPKYENDPTRQEIQYHTYEPWNYFVCKNCERKKNALEKEQA